MEKLIVGVIIFLVIWLIGTVYSVTKFVQSWKQVNRMFEGVAEQSVRFSEKGVSGLSKKSVFTRCGGASRVMEVVVTDKELAIRGIMALFSVIGVHVDLTHRLPLKKVLAARQDGKAVELTLQTAANSTSELVLALQNPDDFLAALQAGR